MRYDRYTIETTAEAEDIIISMLDDLGVEGALIEDSVPLSSEELAGMFVDIALPVKEDDRAYVSFFLDAKEDHEELIKEVRAELEKMRAYVDVGSGRITSSTTEDEDYLNNWKKYFHKFYIDDILFIPSWESEDEDDHANMTIHIDPGTAFGTGMHETTQLCIRALRKYVTPGCKVLDVGTGSGVLSVLAYKFGAGTIIGTDLDPCAESAVSDNMSKNGLSDKGFRLIIGNIIDDEKVQNDVGDGYDIVVANILAQVLVELLPEAVKRLKPGGTIILSGIIEDKEEEMKEACKKYGLKITEITHMGEWVGIVACTDSL